MRQTYTKRIIYTSNQNNGVGVARSGCDILLNNNGNRDFYHLRRSCQLPSGKITTDCETGNPDLAEKKSNATASSAPAPTPAPTPAPAKTTSTNTT